MSDTVILAPRRPVVLGDLVAASVLHDVLLVAAAAAFVGALAQVSIHLPGTPVPVTGQTLGVLLSGTALGWRRGSAAMALYLLAGLAGVPWFSGHASGYVGASFGYIVGFVPCAGLCGFLAEHRADRFVRRSVPAMVAGEAVLYAVGLTWLAIDLHIGAAETLRLGFTPFVAGDAIKAALAALMLPGAWKLVGGRGARS